MCYKIGLKYRTFISNHKKWISLTLFKTPITQNATSFYLHNLINVIGETPNNKFAYDSWNLHLTCGRKLRSKRKVSISIEHF
jgi:hypothetical protein